MKKQHAMRRIFVIAILGLAGLGLTVEQACAGPIKNCLCCKKCCMTLCAKQYNAFSPYCLDSVTGCVPVGGFPSWMPSNGYQGNGSACCYPNGSGMGELPPPGPMGPHSFGSPMMSPGMSPGDAMHGWPAYGPGMMNPGAMPGSYPVMMNNPPMQGVSP